MRQFLAHLTLLFLISCTWKKYPTEKYALSKKYLDLISSYKVGDTLKFQDDKENRTYFLIQKIDSIIQDRRGYFINSGEFKEVSITCLEIINPRPGYEEYNMITVSKLPARGDSTYFNLRLKDFYGIDTNYSSELRNDTVIANNLSFTNYYSFRPYNHDKQRMPNSVNRIYMTNQEGIIAYRYLNGTWWTRVK